jgi:hypothetical protein
MSKRDTNKEFDVPTEGTPEIIRIIIDEDPNLKNRNYEVVGVNGKVWQLKRGTPVEVPPEVVHVLENAVTSYYEQRTDRITGDLVEVEKTKSAISWRRA